MVQAAQIAELAVIVPTAQVAGTVQHPPGPGMGIGHETLAGQLRVVPVPGPHPHPGYGNLPDHPPGGQTQGRVQHIQAEIGQGSADGQVQAIPRQGPVQHRLANIIGGLGRPIGVDQGDTGVQLQPAGQQRRGRRLAGDHGPAQVRQRPLGGRPAGGVVDQFLEYHRHQFHQGHSLLLDQGQQPGRIANGVMVGHHHPPPRQQGGQELPYRNIRGTGGALQKHQLRSQVQGLELGMDMVHRPVVADHGSLGQTSGAGGV